jgi:hypothetical protein
VKAADVYRDGEEGSAFCYGCGFHLAIAMAPGSAVLVPPGFVVRPQRHPSGLERWGWASRKTNHATRHIDLAEWHAPRSEAFYVNCPDCDRGQVVDIYGVLQSAVLPTEGIG